MKVNGYKIEPLADLHGADLRPMIEIWEMLCRDHGIKWTKE